MTNAFGFVLLITLAALVGCEEPPATIAPPVAEAAPVAVSSDPMVACHQGVEAMLDTDRTGVPLTEAQWADLDRNCTIVESKNIINQERTADWMYPHEPPHHFSTAEEGYIFAYTHRDIPPWR